MIAEHSRAVNKLNFHSTDPDMMLSASHDGCVKLWDMRSNESSRLTFDAKSEACRDVQFSSSSNPFQFVSGYDNGSVHIWDIRNPSQSERKWSAHNGLVLTLDWHSNGTWIASGGRDKMIQIWDSKAGTRKPMVSIQCTHSVANVKWSPGTNHIASYSLMNDSRCLL